MPLGWALRRGRLRGLDSILGHGHNGCLPGVPVFMPLRDPAFRITLWYAGGDGAADGQALRDACMRPPFLLGRRDLHAAVRFGALPADGTVDHTGGALALRLEKSAAAIRHKAGRTGNAVVDPDGDRVDHAAAGLADAAALDAARQTAWRGSPPHPTSPG